VFDKYHADPAVSRIVGKYLVLVHVDIAKNAGGDALYSKYGTQRGVPAWTVLDLHQKVLADSGDGAANVGYPYLPKEIDHYVKVLKTTCAKISEAEIDVLKTKLKEVVPKKKEKAVPKTANADSPPKLPAASSPRLSLFSALTPVQAQRVSSRPAWRRWHADRLVGMAGCLRLS
jgi:hypothetical protein